MSGQDRIHSAAPSAAPSARSASVPSLELSLQKAVTQPLIVERRNTLLVEKTTTEDGLLDDESERELPEVVTIPVIGVFRASGLGLWLAVLVFLMLVASGVLSEMHPSHPSGSRTRSEPVEKTAVTPKKENTTSGLPSPCPCQCSRDHAKRQNGDLVGLLPLGTPLPASLPPLNPASPKLQSRIPETPAEVALEAELQPQGPAGAQLMQEPIQPAPEPLPPVPLPHQCVEGKDCVYGLGWCSTTDNPVKPTTPLGSCHRGNCNGPKLEAYPKHFCSNHHLAQINATDLLKDLPKFWLKSLQDVPAFNAWMQDVLDRNGLEGLGMDFDEMLLHLLTIRLGKATGVWFMGCWPPQRFSVVRGVVRAPSGRLKLSAGGLNLVLSAYDLSIRFNNLRADMQCHETWYTIASVTHGREGHPFPADALQAEGELTILCENTRTVMCLALAMMRGWVSRKVVKALPGIVARMLSSIDTLEVSPGCESHMHNSFDLLPYTVKECCEADFAEDDMGCLVGGQFNGKVPGVQKEVKGVRCKKRALDNDYMAECETLPGYYKEESPGVCKEGGVPWQPTKGLDPHWSRVLHLLGVLALADIVLTAAVCWTLLACCCGPRLCRERGECVFTYQSA